MHARFAIPALLAVSLSACATVPPDASYVQSDLSASDAAVIGQAITTFVILHAPPAASTVSINAATVSVPDGALSPLPDTVTADFRKAGYAVASPSAPVQGAHVVRYLVTPLDGQILLRVSVDQSSASQVFAYDTAGALIANSPMTELGTDE